jgi:AcrR family transcriptional regulator
VQYRIAVPDSSSNALRAVALRHFASSGFEGASLQRIADDAGLSKSSVLYHFESKDALFDAALRPGVEAIRKLVDGADRLDSGPGRADFLAEFIDVLFDHRLAIFTIINHGQAVPDQPAIAEANDLIGRIAAMFEPGTSGLPHDREQVRFAIALAGAAFAVVAADRWSSKGADDPAFKPNLAAALAELMLASPPAAAAA